MPAAAKVDGLPPELRAELDARLIETGWRDYRGLSAWLAERGHEIGRSALAVYGREMRERLDAVRLATAQAQALRETIPDDEGAMVEASARIVQQRVFALLVSAEGGDISPRTLAALLRAVAEIARALVALRADRRAAAEATVEVVRDVAGGVLTEEHLRIIGERVYGIVDART